MKPLQCAVVILVGVVSASYGHHHHRHMCPPPFGKIMFEPEKFQGDWHVVSHFLDVPHKHGDETCLKLKYVPSKEGNESRAQITIDIRKSPDEEHKLQMRCVQGGPPGKGGSTSLCAINYDDSKKWGPLVQHQILATDYETYAITQACGVFYKEEEQKFDRIFVVDILSREPTLAADKLKLLKSVASSGEANVDSFTDVSNEGC
ncbi:uncharacterized protein LOC126336709 [Schistocerca gregaria]|uniref:uncharacterized protein LOC126336709 n=1 Tax=Schistocerca gregaria TaxID=7010 RepID=UPI00211F1139|nr:uncharacterized protein LOC126336709 [Schistocerca gregaria]